MTTMIRHIRSSFMLLSLMTLLLGVIYPLFTTAIAQMLFHRSASGSLMMQGEQVVGSELIGQSFTAPKYLWGRPSATTPPYNPMASGGSNLAPGNPAWEQLVKERITALKKADPRQDARIPMDLVTASGSGLDPHITLDAALYQAPRIARARGMKEDAVKSLITSRQQGFGRPYVNVLQVNLALDELSKKEKR